jgi:hypothetical protein
MEKLYGTSYSWKLRNGLLTMGKGRGKAVLNWLRGIVLPFHDLGAKRG